MKQHKPKVITKAEFEEMYYLEDLDVLCERLGVTKTTIYTWLRKFNIPLKGRQKKVIIKE